MCARCACVLDSLSLSLVCVYVHFASTHCYSILCDRDRKHRSSLMFHAAAAFVENVPTVCLGRQSAARALTHSFVRSFACFKTNSNSLLCLVVEWLAGSVGWLIARAIYNIAIRNTLSQASARYTRIDEDEDIENCTDCTIYIGRGSL